VRTRAGITQVLYLNKNLSIEGGYTSTDWSASDPVANPAMLDAQGLGRGLVVSGPVTATVTGLRITGGDATGLGETGGGVYRSHYQRLRDTWQCG
jgi:hypothetical protein